MGTPSTICRISIGDAVLTRKFVMQAWEEDPSYVNWVPAWLARGFPANGAGVAHDVLEHLPGDTGGFETEIQAHGAIYWLRGERYFNMLRSDRNAAWHLASNLGTIMEDVHYGEQTLDPLGAPSPPLRDAEAEAALEETARRTVAFANNHIALVRGDESADDFGETEVQRILEHLRYGYRDARRRYRHLGADRMMEIFSEIERRANELSTVWRDDIGAVLSIGVSLVTGRVAMTVSDRHCN